MFLIVFVIPLFLMGVQMLLHIFYWNYICFEYPQFYVDTEKLSPSLCFSIPSIIILIN